MCCEIEECIVSPVQNVRGSSISTEWDFSPGYCGRVYHYCLFSNSLSVSLDVIQSAILNRSLNGPQINKTEGILSRDFAGIIRKVSISKSGRAQLGRVFQCTLRGRRSIDGRPRSAHDKNDGGNESVRCEQWKGVVVCLCLSACLLAERRNLSEVCLSQCSQ